MIDRSTLTPPELAACSAFDDLALPLSLRLFQTLRAVSARAEPERTQLARAMLIETLLTLAVCAAHGAPGEVMNEESIVSLLREVSQTAVTEKARIDAEDQAAIGRMSLCSWSPSFATSVDARAVALAPSPRCWASLIRARACSSSRCRWGRYPTVGRRGKRLLAAVDGSHPTRAAPA